MPRVLRHCRGCHHNPFPAAAAGRIPGRLVMVAGGLVDDTVFSIAQRAGEPDNIPGSRAANFWFYGMVFH